MKIIGIDPDQAGEDGVAHHHLALLNEHSDLKLGQIDMKYERYGTWWSDYYHANFVGSTYDQALKVPIVLEYPEYQGSKRNAVPLIKAATILLLELLEMELKVYTPPPRVIRKVLVGKATAGDKDILMWLRSQGYQTGKGTEFTHAKSHNADALLAALWGRHMMVSEVGRKKMEQWREPR